MNIIVMVKPGSSRQEIEKFAPDRFLVKLKSLARYHEANTELMNVLSKYFGIPVSHIIIKHGFNEKTKLVEIT